MNDFTCEFLTPILDNLPKETIITIKPKQSNVGHFLVVVDNDLVDRMGYKVTVQTYSDNKKAKSEKKSQLEAIFTEYLKDLEIFNSYALSNTGYTNIVYYCTIECLDSIFRELSLKNISIIFDFDVGIER